MVKSTLFKKITIVFPDGIREGDIFVKDGKIEKVGPSLSDSAEETVHEKGLVLIPGMIDPHVHFRDPGFPHKETFESGSKAAAAGGVTSFFDMPNTAPLTTTVEALVEKKKLASQSSIINYNFYIGAQQKHFEHLFKAENVPGMKLFVGSSTGSLLVCDPDELEAIFSKANGRLIAVHSEKESIVQKNAKRFESSTDVKDHYKNIRTAEAALKQTQDLVSLALKHQVRLHICHLTTKEEAIYLKDYINKSLITTEVSLQHLLLWGPDIYDKIGTKAQINPPIRDKSHADQLWVSLKQGTISCIGSDHAPHTLEEKNQPFGKAPSGMPGVQTSLPLLLNLVHQKKATLEDVVKWTSSQTAKTFKIKNKGFIAEGYDADLVLIDLKKTQTISKNMLYSKAGWSAFEDWSLSGWPIATYVKGQLVYREKDFFLDIKGSEILIE